MPITRHRRMTRQTVATASSTTTYFIPAGDWEECDGITGAKFWGDVRAKNGSIQLKPAVQTAIDKQNPDTPTALTQSWITADGSISPVKATFNTDGKRHIRPGWMILLESGSTLATAWVDGEIAYEL